MELFHVFASAFFVYWFFCLCFTFSILCTIKHNTVLTYCFSSVILLFSFIFTPVYLAKTIENVLNHLNVDHY